MTFANTKNEFKYAVDSLNYDLSVEWDQKNTETYNNYVSSFQNKIQLLKEQGLNNQEMKEAVLELVPDPKLVEQLSLQANSVDFYNLDEVNHFILSNREQFYVKGASWVGDVWTNYGSGILTVALIAIITIVIVHESKWVCTEYAETSCSTRKICAPGQRQSNGTCSRYIDDYSCSQGCEEGYYKD